MNVGGYGPPQLSTDRSHDQTAKETRQGVGEGAEIG